LTSLDVPAGMDFRSTEDGSLQCFRGLSMVADRAETVAPILVQAMLNMDKTGKSIRAVTAWQILKG
jgi:hypothetical protein